MSALKQRTTWGGAQTSTNRSYNISGKRPGALLAAGENSLRRDCWPECPRVTQTLSPIQDEPVPGFLYIATLQLWWLTTCLFWEKKTKNKNTFKPWTVELGKLWRYIQYPILKFKKFKAVRISAYFILLGIEGRNVFVDGSLSAIYWFQQMRDRQIPPFKKLPSWEEELLWGRQILNT